MHIFNLMAYMFFLVVVLYVKMDEGKKKNDDAIDWKDLSECFKSLTVYGIGFYWLLFMGAAFLGAGYGPGEGGDVGQFLTEKIFVPIGVLVIVFFILYLVCERRNKK